MGTLIRTVVGEAPLMKADRMGAFLLVVLGVLTLGTGLHFVFIRPAMLPEDVLFAGTDPSLLKPEMLAWLRIVFRTWGGFIVSFGIMMMSVGVYLLTSHAALLRLGVALALPVAFGQFLASNVRLHSDYLLFIGGLSVEPGRSRATTSWP